MNDEQYAALVVMLSAVSQVPGALRLLDQAQLDNISFLLDEVQKAITTEYRRRVELARQQRTKQIDEEHPERGQDEDVPLV